jgi:cellulose synthase/poly-beta-1,6-N-acetylglucosamine synthase-like glycosyltransferase
MAAELRTVVVSWGGSERLGSVLDAIERAGEPYGGEIVIVGRPGDEGVARMASRATVLAPDPGSPNTPGAHRNQGARGATAPWILFADGDVAVEAAFVRDAVALLAARPEVVAVGGRIHERQWRGQTLVREVPDLHKSGAGGEVEMVAAAWIARRSAFEAVRGFDPRLPAEEDMELCVRLAAAGGKVIALDQRAAYHDCAPRPSWAEIRRRFAGGLFAGQGLLLRYSWGTPFFARHLWRQRLFLATLAYALLGVVLAAFSLVAGGARTALALWTLGALGVWALMALRKRSLVLGGLAVATWLALGFGIARAWITGSPGRAA